jgi:HD-like signal output (HDOD) protein
MPDSFPTLPSAIQKMQAIFAQGEVNSRQLVELLESDPLLCANILKIVNSAHYGLPNKVSAVNQAVMLLGTTIIRGIVMAAMLKKSFALNLSPYNITIEQFDQISTLRARFINSWAKEFEVDIQTLSAAAFLMESGKIITSNIIVQNNYTTQFWELLKSHTIEDAEKILFAADSYTVAGILFQKWDFEKKFTDMIIGILQSQTLEQKLLHVSSVLISTEGILTEQTLQKASQLLEEYELDGKSFNNISINLQKELA